jgi:hypothetical protein
MLKLNGADFTIGCSRFFDTAVGGGEQTAKIYVKIMPEALGLTILAQLDTGAAWSIFEPEIAAAMGILDAEGVPVRLSTRHGEIPGHLVDGVSVAILADEGEGLNVNATVFVSRDWPRGNFIGYSGFLERIRIGLDPGDNSFHFGPIP